MTYLGDVIVDLITKWSQDTYILLRIRVLMGLLIFMYYSILPLSGVLSFSTRRPRVTVLDVVSETLLVYILGAMQAAPFNNRSFPFWALCLVSFRSGVNFLSKFDMSFETVNLVKLWAVALLYLKHGSDDGLIPFWLIWCGLVVKSLYRFMAHFGGSKNLWYGPSTELLHRYMSRNRNDFNPHTLVGCKYLVYGEQKSSEDNVSLITIGKVWQLKGPLENRINRNDKIKNKHLAMAFALSRLLSCRLEGAKLHSNTMAKKLICSMLEPALQSEAETALQFETELARIPEEDNTDRAKELFGILEMELMFLTHHLHTGYRVVFCLGLPSYFFHVVMYAVRYGLLIWFFRRSSRVDAPTSVKSSDAADMRITIFAFSIMAAIDSLEQIRYLTSYWTRLLAMCKYVSCSSRCLRFLLRFMISCGHGFFSEKLKLTFSNRYDLLHSSTSTSGVLKPFTGKMGLPKRFVLTPKESTELVMVAAIQALARHLKGPQPRLSVPVNQELQIQFVTDSEGCLPLPPALIQELVRHMVTDCLPGVGLTPPAASDRTAAYWLAFLQLQSCSHVILVWHIATSLCGMDLATVNAANALPKNENLEKAYTRATYISRYCLYLLISRPILLPENIVASKIVLLDTIKSARVMLEDCVSWEGKFATLLPEEAARAHQHRQDMRFVGNMLEQGDSNRQDIKLDGNILEQGAILAKELINTERDEVRWEILAEVWTDLLLHIAPNSNAEAHAQNLTPGAEFITLLWALLSHCGIEKSKLWPENTQAGGTLLEHLKRNTAHALVRETDNSAPPA